MFATVTSTLTRAVLLLMAAFMALCGLTATASPASAEEALMSAMSGTIVTVDVEFAAENASFAEKTGTIVTAPLAVTLQSSGFYVSTDGKVIASAVALDPNSTKVKNALENWYVEKYILTVDRAIAPILMEDYKPGKITVRSITLTDSNNPNGVDAEYKIKSTTKDGYALLTTDTKRTTKALPISTDEPTVGTKYKVFVGDNNSTGTEHVRFNLAYATVEEQEVSPTRRFFVSQEVTQFAAAAGGVMLNDDRQVIGLLTVETDDETAVYLMSNAALRSFAEKEGVLNTSSPSVSPSPSASAPSASPTSESPATEAPSPTATADIPSGDSGGVPPSSQFSWLTMALAGAGLIALLAIVGVIRRRRALKRSDEPTEVDESDES